MSELDNRAATGGKSKNSGAPEQPRRNPHPRKPVVVLNPCRADIFPQFSGSRWTRDASRVNSAGLPPLFAVWSSTNLRGGRGGWVR